MRQKMFALVIVCLIGTVTTFVLYSPAALERPRPKAPAMSVAAPFVPATPASGTLATPASSIGMRSNTVPSPHSLLRSETVRVEMVTPPRAEAIGAPLDEPPSIVTERSFADGVPLAASIGGLVPTQPSASGAHRGAFEVAGRSIGGALVTTGRTVGTAFKKVF